jgi:CheY-like chemotaxis protein
MSSLPVLVSETSVILLVEDREDDVLLVRRGFERAKLVNPLMVVRSGEEAITYLRGEGKYSNRSEYPLPDLILLDLKMPGLDGYDVLRWIRTQAHFRALRVIVLTSSEDIYDVDKAYGLGANSFLVKPSSFDNYVELLRSMNGYWMWLSEIPRVARPEEKSPLDR